MDPVLLYAMYLLGFILFIFIYLWLSNHLELRYTLGRIPGPKTYPFVGLFWKIRKIPPQDKFKWFNDLCFSFKNGIVVTWLGTKPIVNIRKPLQIQTIIDNSTFIYKPGFNKILELWLGTSTFTSSGKVWCDHREFVKSGYVEVIEKYSIVMLERVKILMERIEKELLLNHNKYVNISDLVYKYSLDTICQMALGVDTGIQVNKNNEYVNAFERCCEVLTNRRSLFWIKWKFMFCRTEIGKRFLNNVNIMNNFVEKIIIQRQVNKKEKAASAMEGNNDYTNGDLHKTTLLDELLNVIDSTGSIVSIEEIREELQTFIFAGHNTMSSAIALALFAIGNDRDVQKKLQEEINNAFVDADESITMHKLDKMQYVDRVIMESLRLYPSVAFFDRVIVKDSVIENFFIPKETTVRLQIYQLHNDPDIWEDPQVFYPDRFSPENSIGRHPFAYIPFGAGPRNCIGKKLALLYMKIALIAILRKWDVMSTLPASELKLMSNFNLQPFNGRIELYLTPVSKVQSN